MKQMGKLYFHSDIRAGPAKLWAQRLQALLNIYS